MRRTHPKVAAEEPAELRLRARCLMANGLTTMSEIPALVTGRCRMLAEQRVIADCPAADRVIR